MHLPSPLALAEAALFVVCLLATAAAQAAPTQVYQGTLGPHTAIVLEMSDAPNGVKKGRYFYQRHGVDIPLRGPLSALAEALPMGDFEQSDDTPEGVFTDPRTQKPRIVWAGRLEGDLYSGTWRDTQSGKSLPFSLRRVATYDPDQNRPGSVEAVSKAVVQGSGSDVASGTEISMANAPYDHLRLKVAMSEGKEIAFGEVAYRMVTDPRTQVAYPRLTRHPDAAVLTRTNALLEQRHWAMNLEALACASSRYTQRGPSAGTLGGYDEESITVDYLSTTLMSVVESGSTDCGGAHPNNHYDPYTLDLLQGGYLDFSRVFKGYGRGDTHDGFVKFLRAAVKRHPEPSPHPDVDCAGEWPSYLALHFKAPNKVSFDISGVGHAMGVCLGPHLTLSFNQIKPILQPDAARYLKP